MAINIFRTMAQSSAQSIHRVGLWSRPFSNDFLTCSTVLTDPDGVELGRTVKSFSDNSSTIITTDSKGQKLVKKFSNNMLNMEAVLTDAAGKELARLTKVFSADGKDISSTVVYGK